MKELIKQLQQHIVEEEAKDFSTLKGNKRKEAEYNLECLKKFLVIQEEMFKKHGG